jgi:hypothetical protein
MKNDDYQFYHDEPNSESELFEFSWLAETLSQIILRQMDTPFAITIDGEWGSGKTSLLKKTQDVLQNKLSEQNKKEDYVIIWFDAWDYEKVDAVSGLLYKIQENLPGNEGHQFKQRAIQFASLLFDIAARRYTNMSKDEIQKHFEDTMEAINTIRDDLTNLLREKKVKLIVFVDDLDRCSFETMIGISESIKIFLNASGVIFIIAADNEKLHLAWKNKYPKFEQNEAVEYFDKFFQLKIKLPIKETVQIENYLKNINSFMPKKLETLFINSLDNPRKIKQILNKIFFLLKYNNVLNGKSNSEIGEYLSAVTIWSILITAFPELSRRISKNMISFLDLLVIVNHFQNFELLETSYERALGKYNISDNEGSVGPEGAIITRLTNSTRNCLELVIKNKKIYEFFAVISRMFELEPMDRNNVKNYVSKRHDSIIGEIMMIKDISEVNSLVYNKYPNDQGQQNTMLTYHNNFSNKYKNLFIILVDVIKIAKILYS